MSPRMSLAGRRVRSLIVCFSLVAGLYCTVAGLAQSQPSASAAGAAAPMTVEEKVAVEKAVLSDQRIRVIVGSGQTRVITADVEVDKAEAEAFLAGTSEKPPTRRVTIVVFNVQANRAARSLVSLAESRILSVQRVNASDVPFTREDADQALVLAKADAAVRRAIGETLDRFQILDSGDEARVPYAAQALPLRSTDPRDPCRVDRCLDLIFRTESGYLPVRAHVNLTKRSVAVPSGAPHR
jgi:hypothetical protein